MYTYNRPALFAAFPVTPSLAFESLALEEGIIDVNAYAPADTPRHLPVVVTIRKEMCEGCRVGIPPQSYIELLRGESMVSCVNCQRILVHEERLQALGAG